HDRIAVDGHRRFHRRVPAPVVDQAVPDHHVVLGRRAGGACHDHGHAAELEDRPGRTHAPAPCTGSVPAPDRTGAITLTRFAATIAPRAGPGNREGSTGALTFTARGSHVATFGARFLSNPFGQDARGNG